MQIIVSIVSLIALSTYVSSLVVLPTTDWVKSTSMNGKPDSDLIFSTVKCDRTPNDYVYMMGVSTYDRSGTGKVLSEIKLYCITPGTKPVFYPRYSSTWNSYGNAESEIRLASSPLKGYTSMTIKRGEVIDGINFGTDKVGLPGDGGYKYNLIMVRKVWGVKWAKLIDYTPQSGSVVGLQFLIK